MHSELLFLWKRGVGGGGGGYAEQHCFPDDSYCDATWYYAATPGDVTLPVGLLRPSSPTSKRSGKSLAPQSQSVRPSTAAVRLPAHMRAARVQTVCGICYQK